MNELDIYNFLSKAGVGKIRDVKIIRDQRSGKSKGYDRATINETYSIKKSRFSL